MPTEGAAPQEDRGPPRQELQLDLPAVHTAARMARHLVRQFGRANGVKGRELDHMVLVADELLTNAVDHGGGHAADDESTIARPARMFMYLRVSAERWELRVADQGGGAPEMLDAALHPTREPDLDDERGRGFYLLSTMVDSLDVRRSDDGLGLVLIAVRNLRRA